MTDNTEQQAIGGEEDLTFIVNELLGIWKYTHSFDDDPQKKHRQLARNTKALEKFRAKHQQLISRHYIAKEAATNQARYILHGILSDDVDSELDHSDIEQRFNDALTALNLDSGTEANHDNK